MPRKYRTLAKDLVFRHQSVLSIPLLCFACSTYCADRDASGTDESHSLSRIRKEKTLFRADFKDRNENPMETCGGS